MNYFYILLMLMAFGGLTLSFYIHSKKRLGQKLICPIGSDCDNVIHSKYSRLFNVPLEVIGALYYTIIVMTYSIFLVVPTLHSAGAALVILEMTTVAFLFSLYLTGVQAVILKEWCTWCLTSAAICTIIFLIEFKFVGFDIIGLLKTALF